MSNWTVAQLKEEIEKLGYQVPSGLRKDDLILFYVGARVMIEKKIPQIDLKKVKALSMLCSHTAHAVSDTNAQKCPLPDCLHPTPVKANPELDWRTHLYTYGWTIRKIPNFDPKSIREGLLNWLHRTCPGFDPVNPVTWTRDHIPFNLHGIFKNWVGHLPELWKTREACHETFAELWQTPDLLSSYDGFCFLPGGGRSQYKQWIHCDQGRKVRTFACVQGIVNLFPNEQADGGTILMSGSHTRFDSYLDNHPIEGIAGFFPIDPIDLTLKGCQMVKPCLEEGEILLFDSRTFHCNLAPLSINPRMCVYVSMMPRSGASQEDLAKRQKLYYEGRMTGHWCYGPFFTVCEKEPREMYTKGTPKPVQLEIAQLNPAQARLAGF